MNNTMTTKLRVIPAAFLLDSLHIIVHSGDMQYTDSEIRIGQFAAQTGPAAELGKRTQLGIQAHFAAVNTAGGINVRKLLMVSRDDGYEPKKAASAVRH